MKYVSNNRLRSWHGIPAIIVAGLILLYSSDLSFHTETVAELMESTRIALSVIDKDAFAHTLPQPEVVETPEYELIREQLYGISDVLKYTGLRGLYTMKFDGDAVIFYADSAPSDDPWHSEPGTHYEEPPAAIQEVFGDGTARFTGPYTDEYGTFYSTFAPIVGRDGTTLGVMGSDIEVSAYRAALKARRLPIIQMTILFAGLYTFTLFLVNARQQRLKFIKEYTKRLEILIEQLPVGVLIFEGKEGYVSMANGSALMLLGREIDPSKPASSFSETYRITYEDGRPYPSEDLPVAIALRSGKQASGNDLFISYADGSMRTVKMTSVPIMLMDEKATSVAMVIEDMTKEHETDRLKTEFISIASHELRAPLTGIKWNAGLLLDKSEGRLSATQRAYVKNIDDINDRLVNLVNELLNVSRLETGTVPVEPVTTDVNALIDVVLGDLEGLYGKKRQKLEYARRPLPELEIDPRLIRQVFTNLVTNAVKYTPEGGVISLDAKVRETDVLFTVKDGGIGIPKAQQSQIFKKFFRASNASEKKIEGTGLGLYICKQAVEMSGGTIGFESEEGKGAKFWFTLPLSGSERRQGTKALT